MAAARPAHTPPQAWTQLELRLAQDAAGCAPAPPRARLRRLFRLVGIHGSTQLVGWLVWSYSNKRGMSHPSQAELSAAAGLSLSTTKRALRRLERVGVVWKRRRRGASQYRLNLTGQRRPPRAAGAVPDRSPVTYLDRSPVTDPEGGTTEGRSPPIPPASGGARLSAAERRRRAEADRIAGPATARTMNACPRCGAAHRRTDPCQSVGTPAADGRAGGATGGVEWTSEPESGGDAWG